MTDSFDIGEAFGAEKGYSERFAVYVPNKDRNGQAVPQEHWVSEIIISTRSQHDRYDEIYA